MVKEFFQKVFSLAESPAPQPRTLVLHTEGVGTTGTESYAGYPNEEYLQTLQGTERAKVYDKMRRSDPQVKMLLSAVRSPIESALWKVEPADANDPESVEDAKLVEWVLFHGMRKSFKQFVKEALSFLSHGYSAFEIIDKVNIDHPEFGTINMIDDLAFRSQKTVERFNLDPKTDTLKSITQVSNGDLNKYVDIPAEFLVVFSLDREGSNYEGISAIRCCYGNWFRKNTYLKLNAIGIEKFAVPTPIAEVPIADQKDPQYQNLINSLERYVGHHKNYIIHPTGWKINLQTNTYDPEKVEVSIDNEDKRMTKAFMANFLELGMNGFGSQSLSFDLSDFFLSSLDHIAGIVTEGLNDHVIPRIIQMNRGPRTKYPKICVTGISDRAGKEFAEVLDILTRNKIVKPDDKLEEYSRERFNLPEADAATAREVQPQQQNNPAPSSNPKFSEKVRRLLR